MTAADDFYKDLSTVDICLIQEPPIKNKRIPRIPKTHKQFLPASPDKPRVAQLIPVDLAKKAMSLGTFNTKDSLVLRINISKTVTILLASIYMESADPLPGQLLTRLTDYAENERLPLIICTDSNAHHTTWGHHNINIRGRNLLQQINSNNLIINNSGTVPTFQGHLGSSCIDLTISNLLAVNLISNWKVGMFKSNVTVLK
jgi:hypothetical protein